MTSAVKCLAAAALLLCGPLAASAQSTQEPPPVADPGIGAQTQCIAEKTSDVGTWGNLRYRIELTNKCEQRLRCQVYAYIIGSRGPSQGAATMILAPASRGKTATKAFEIPLRSTGSFASMSHRCRVF